AGLGPQGSRCGSTVRPNCPSCTSHEPEGSSGPGQNATVRPEQPPISNGLWCRPEVVCGPPLAHRSDGVRCSKFPRLLCPCSPCTTVPEALRTLHRCCLLCVSNPLHW